MKLWHIATEQELMTLEGYEGVSQALAFAPSGETLISIGQTETGREIHLWRAPRGKPTNED